MRSLGIAFAFFVLAHVTNAARIPGGRQEQLDLLPLFTSIAAGLNTDGQSEFVLAELRAGSENTCGVWNEIKSDKWRGFVAEMFSTNEAAAIAEFLADSNVDVNVFLDAVDSLLTYPDATCTGDEGPGNWRNFLDDMYDAVTLPSLDEIAGWLQSNYTGGDESLVFLAKKLRGESATYNLLLKAAAHEVGQQSLQHLIDQGVTNPIIVINAISTILELGWDFPVDPRLFEGNLKELLYEIIERLNVQVFVTKLYAFLDEPDTNMCILWSWMNGNEDSDQAFITLLDKVAADESYAALSDFLASDEAGNFDMSIIRPTIDRFLEYEGATCTVTTGDPALDALLAKLLEGEDLPTIDDILAFLLNEVLGSDAFNLLLEKALAGEGSIMNRLAVLLLSDPTVAAISDEFIKDGFDDPRPTLQLIFDLLGWGQLPPRP